jgi:hypothetical protein
MKKLILIASLLLGMSGILSAQTTPAKSTSSAKTATTKPATGPTKKDGTPDMRYKANKEAAKTPTQHLKKDGTPDKRYKENKDKKSS